MIARDCSASPTMANNLIHDLSTNALKRHIGNLVAANGQSLEISAKTFLAVANLQHFDECPDRVDVAEMEQLIEGGHVELNRGLAPSAGQAATFYVNQFLSGPMFPGAVIVHGHGIYLAEPSRPDNQHRSFPRTSEVAERYATKGGGFGVIMRCALKPDARTMESSELSACFREDRNRARGAGIADFGTYAAAIGLDAFYVDEHFSYSKERTWIVVNRRALIVQNRGLRVPGKVG